MGQYYLVVNLDKKQFFSPHALGDGVKLLEFVCSANGAMTALAVLLADGNGRGGGDLITENPIVGSWAGDRIVISGDYSDDGKFVTDEWTAQYISAIRKHPISDYNRQNNATDYEQFVKYNPEGKPNLEHVAGELFENIGVQVLAALLDDAYLKDSLIPKKNPDGTEGYISNKGELAQALELQKQYQTHNWYNLCGKGKDTTWMCHDCNAHYRGLNPPRKSWKVKPEDVKPKAEEKVKVNLPADTLLDPMREEAFKDMN